MLIAMACKNKQVDPVIPPALHRLRLMIYRCQQGIDFS